MPYRPLPDRWGRDRFRYPELQWYRALTLASTARPLTAAQVRTRLKLDPDADADADLEDMIDAASDWWQEQTGTALMPQKSDLRLDAFPRYDSRLPLMHWPIRAVNSVRYYDEDDADQTWAATHYYADLAARGGLLTLRPDQTWPDTARRRSDAVRVNLDVGYASAAAVPAEVRRALYLHVGMQYRYREEAADADAHPIPYGCHSIARRWRISWFPREIR